MSEPPQWLANALAGQATVVPMPSPLAPAESLPAAGDVRPLVAMDVRAGPTPRIVLVMDVDPDVRFATIALTTNETDLATEDDALVRAGLSGAPFDLLVELDLQGTARPCQLGRKLGHIDIDLLRDRDRVPRGVPVRIEGDERVAFKNAEFETLHALAGEAMADAEARHPRPAAVPDPDAIREVARTNPPMLSELVKRDAAGLPGCVAELLLFDASGHDELVLLGGLFQRSLETDTAYAVEGEPVAWHPTGESGSHELLEATITSTIVPEVGELRVTTIRSLWRAQTGGPPYCDRRGRRMQLDLEYVDAA